MQSQAHSFGVPCLASNGPMPELWGRPPAPANKPRPVDAPAASPTTARNKRPTNNRLAPSSGDAGPDGEISALNSPTKSARTRKKRVQVPETTAPPQTTEGTEGAAKGKIRKSSARKLETITPAASTTKGQELAEPRQPPQRSLPRPPDLKQEHLTDIIKSSIVAIGSAARDLWRHQKKLRTARGRQVLSEFLHAWKSAAARHSPEAIGALVPTQRMLAPKPVSMLLTDLFSTYPATWQMLDKPGPWYTIPLHTWRSTPLPLLCILDAVRHEDGGKDPLISDVRSQGDGSKEMQHPPSPGVTGPAWVGIHHGHQTAMEAVARLKVLATPKVRVSTMCAMADALMMTRLKTLDLVGLFMSKPTSIAVNECLGPYSPDTISSIHLRGGDVCKVVISFMADGRVLQVASTMTISPTPTRHANPQPALSTGPTPDFIAQTIQLQRHLPLLSICSEICESAQASFGDTVTKGIASIRQIRQPQIGRAHV